MKQRIITGILLAILIVGVVLLAEEILFAFIVGLLVLLSTIEMLKMFARDSEINKKHMIMTCILTLGLYFGIVIFWYYAEIVSIFTVPVVLVLVMFFMLFALGMLVFSRNLNSDEIGKVLFTMLYVSIGFASLTILRYFGRRFLVYLFLISASTDIFAYFFGIKFGKHKIAPNISPKKSWEGSIAGSVFGTLISVGFALTYGPIFRLFPDFLFFSDPNADVTILTSYATVLPFELEVIIITCISLIGTIIGQIGDLVASKIKREYQIKDFGSLFPGHGGVLDRFDSAIYLGLFLVFAFTIIKIIFPLV